MEHLLWTLQDRAAYDIFEKTGVLHTDQSRLAFDGDYQLQYSWMAEQMRKRLGEPPRGVAVLADTGENIPPDHHHDGDQQKHTHSSQEKCMTKARELETPWLYVILKTYPSSSGSFSKLQSAQQ